MQSFSKSAVLAAATFGLTSMAAAQVLYIDSTNIDGSPSTFGTPGLAGFEAAFPDATVETFSAPLVTSGDGSAVAYEGLNVSGGTDSNTDAAATPPNIALGLDSATASAGPDGETLAYMFVGNTGLTSVTIEFPGPVNAFGADFFDAASNDGAFVVLDGTSGPVFSDTTELQPTVGPGQSQTNTGTGFLGLSAPDGETFTSITFSAVGNVNPEGIVFDNLRYNLVVIPEPASLGLLSVAGLGLLRRRK